jgi:hypothetical protein
LKVDLPTFRRVLTKDTPTTTVHLAFVLTMSRPGLAVPLICRNRLSARSHLPCALFASQRVVRNNPLLSTGSSRTSNCPISSSLAAITMTLRYASSPDEKVRFSDPTTLLPYGEPRRAIVHPLRERWIKRILPAILTLLALFALFRTAFVCNHRYDPGKPFSPMNVLKDTEKVPLEIHVMSKCPDARDCLQELILPTMVEVSDKVNFTMSFIGR